MKKQFFLFFILILTILTVSSCKKIYICEAEGTQTEDPTTCQKFPTTSLHEKEAEKIAHVFVLGYLDRDSRSQIVSLYYNKKEGGYETQVVISSNIDSPYEATILVDGTTKKVSCLENCKFMPTYNVSMNETEN